jgi:hypothetical protein
MNILRPIQQEFYGDDYRWFFATVINAVPPAGLEGRVKVRINGVHNPSTGEIPERDLPWAQVLIPTTEGGVSGVGRIPQLVAGAFVFGVFIDGKSSQIPLILGSLPRVEQPTSVQTARAEMVFKDDNVPAAKVDLRRLQSMKFFIDNNYSPIHAAAITGALIGASSLITYFEKDPASSYVGIASWERVNTAGSRYNGLLRFAANQQPSKDWRLYSTQLQFVLYELNNRFNQVNSKLLATTDLKEASKVINRDYLFTTVDTEDLAEFAYNEVLV